MKQRRGAKKYRIAVLMGGSSAERDISLKSGRAVQRALRRRGYDVVGIDVKPTLPQQLRRRNIDVAFISLHGPGGEDGTVQGLLEIMNVPYTGSSVRANAIAMHKHAAKVLLSHHGVPVPSGVLMSSTMDRTKKPRTILQNLAWPVVVKPATQGSTFGISIVRKPSEWSKALQHAFTYDTEVLAEQYIPGRELTVGVLQSGHRTRVLPPLEILIPSGFYDYRAKYEKGGTSYLCPAPLPKTLSKRLETLALESYSILGCRGAARVDFRVTSTGDPFVLELNTIPGMTETSLLPMAAAKAGIGYDALTEKILQSAFQSRHPKPKRKLDS